MGLAGHRENQVFYPFPPPVETLYNTATRHEDRVRERFRRGLQCPADLEEETRCENLSDHAKLRSVLRDELC